MNESSITLIGERIRTIARSIFPKPLYSRCSEMFDAWYGIRKFGLKEYKKLSAVSSGTAGEAPVVVNLRPLAHPFYIRPGSPDASLVLHAIAREAYSCRLPGLAVRFVIDAGANIGDTTVWYATRFPEAEIVAIEPSPNNFDILSRNCAPYGDRIRLLRAALWPVAERSMAITGATVGAQVQESIDANDLTCSSIDPVTILRDSGHETIDIFKIDIEGAELALFSGDCDTWLRKTRSIAIEIHSPEAREAVLSATRRNGFKCTIYRDLHVFVR
jgi:FkbM family methyltransferase